MKKIVLVLILIASFANASKNSGVLSLFVNYNQKEIELKWFVPQYSSKYTYEIYRSEGKNRPKLIKKVKPISIEVLKKAGYSEDYIFMIYPFAQAKNFADKIEILQVEQRVSGFRLLNLMTDDAFAQNIGQYYKDMSVKKDKIYTYTLVAYRDKKVVYDRSIIAHTHKKAKRHDFMWVKAKPLADEIGLKWDVQDAFAYYNVYRKLNGEKKFKKLNKNFVYISREFAQKAKFLYRDNSIKMGEKATYYIKKVDMFTNEGRASSKFFAELKPTVKKPAMVLAVSVVNSDKRRVIRWEKSEGNLGYNVYRSTIYQGNFRKINTKPIKDEVYYDEKFKSDKNYYYYITAINLKGESQPSLIKLAYARDTTAPNKPVKVEAKVKSGAIAFTWDALKDDSLAGYRIYMSMDEDAAQWILLNKNLIKKNSYDYNISKKLSRLAYYYRVSAVDKTFNESYPSKIIKVKLPDVTAPKQPFVKKFRAYSHKIVIEWTKIEVYDLDYYNVYKKVDKKYIKLNKNPIFMSMFEDKKPQYGMTEYVVTAVDKSGNESLKTKTKKIVLADIKPVKIESFKLLKIKDGIKASFTCKDKDYTGFVLMRRGVNEPNYTNVSNFVKSKSYTDNSISKNTKYFYMIKAYDKAGNIKESKVLSIKHK